MAGIITSHPWFKAMKLTLDNLTTDNLEKDQVCIGKGKLISKLEAMKDGYVDDMESAGTTLLQQRGQGEAIASGSITPGGSARYWPRSMGLQLTIAEETMDDVKYFSELINPSKRLLASAYKTQDIDCASLVNNSATAVGGYDQTTLVATHSLPGGGTQANRLTTYMTPSVPALMLVRANLALMKDPNGLPCGVTMKRVVCPEIQADLWKILLKTTGAPGSNFNDINIAQSYNLGEPLAIKWLDGASTSQWGVMTDAENGFRGFAKKKITSITWEDNACLATHHAVYYRMALGWSNWRCWYQGNT